jgi:hypothetical protein
MAGFGGGSAAIHKDDVTMPQDNHPEKSGL